MDGPSWTPFFQPSFADDPINTTQTFDDPFDQAFDQTYDWAQTQWAPLQTFDMTAEKTGSRGFFSGNGASFPGASWPQPVTTDDYHMLQIGSSDFSLYPESLSSSLNKTLDDVVINGTVPPGHQENQVCCVPPKPLAHLRVAETNVAEKSPDVLSEEYLSTLTPKQLEEFKNRATELLEKSHKKSQEAVVTPPLQQHQRPTRRSNLPGRAQKGSITCEHPGCTTTFSRKKDQNRHFRLKHGNPQESFRCPIIDCRMGEGHEFQRSDKLRDHLNTKSLASATWQCIFPGCPETRAGKEGILDHLGTHELDTRAREVMALRAYGFHNAYSYEDRGYLQLKNICTIYGCPFGTDSDDVMKSHLLTPHEGPLCPCPITTCEQSFRDRNGVSEHLSRDHDALTREYFKNHLTDQGFWWGNAVFVCPICKFEIREEYHPCSIGGRKLRMHFETHDFTTVAENREILLQAFVFSFGRKPWPNEEDISDHQIIKRMTGHTLETLSNAISNLK